MSVPLVPSSSGNRRECSTKTTAAAMPPKRNLPMESSERGPTESSILAAPLPERIQPIVGDAVRAEVCSYFFFLLLEAPVSPPKARICFSSALISSSFSSAPPPYGFMAVSGLPFLIVLMICSSVMLACHFGSV